MPSKNPMNAGVITAEIGVQSSPVRLTATSDGNTTGVIPAGASFISVTSASSSYLLKLPYPVLGNRIMVVENGSTGYKVIPQAKTQYINGTLVDASKALACAGGTWVAVFTCIVGGAAGKWIQHFLDDDGTVDAGGTPS